MSLGIVLLGLAVVASGRVASGVQETLDHGSPIKHGKQEHDVDGHHNVHFDHEAILGMLFLFNSFVENNVKI